MNKIFEFFISVLMIVGIVIVTIIFSKFFSQKFGAILLTGTPAVYSVTVSPATSTAVLPANTGREYAEICNSGSSDVFLALTSTTSTAETAKGVIVKYTECYTISEKNGNMWIGPIYAVASSTTSTLSILTK